MSYLNKPNGFYVANGLANMLVEEVPKGFYSIMFDPDVNQFYLSPAAPLTINHKVYGKSDKWADRILETFQQRQSRSTSAAFVGEKGSGKSLLLKRIAINFESQFDGIVLTVDQPYHGTAFNSFLQSITQSKIVVFDEFEKLYAEDQPRNAVLSLLDGIWPQHTLFLITANTSLYSHRLEYFNNRPGRVYFNIEFKSVDLDIVNEYLDDNLIDKSRTKEVIDFVSRFTNFNIDMLSVLVYEMNTHPSDTVEELSQILNIKPQSSAATIDLEWTIEHIESGFKYNPDDLILNENDFIQWINNRESTWNPYTISNEDESEESSEKGFDLYIERSDSVINQDPHTRAITVVSQGYKFTATPIYKSFLTPNQYIAL